MRGFGGTNWSAFKSHGKLGADSIGIVRLKTSKKIFFFFKVNMVTVNFDASGLASISFRTLRWWMLAHLKTTKRQSRWRSLQASLPTGFDKYIDECFGWMKFGLKNMVLNLLHWFVPCDIDPDSARVYSQRIRIEFQVYGTDSSNSIETVERVETGSGNSAN